MCQERKKRQSTCYTSKLSQGNKITITLKDSNQKNLLHLKFISNGWCTTRKKKTHTTFRWVRHTYTHTLHTQRDNRRMAVGVESLATLHSTECMKALAWGLVCAGGIGEKTKKRREFYSRRVFFCLANRRQDSAQVKWLLFLKAYLTVILDCWKMLKIDEKSFESIKQFKLTQHERASLLWPTQLDRAPPKKMRGWRGRQTLWVGGRVKEKYSESE